MCERVRRRESVCVCERERESKSTYVGEKVSKSECMNARE